MPVKKVLLRVRLMRGLSFVLFFPLIEGEVDDAVTNTLTESYIDSVQHINYHIIILRKLLI